MEETQKKRRAPFNRNGGLTIVAMPGFKAQAQRVADRIDALSRSRSKKYTPVDVVVPEFGTRPSGEPFLPLGKRHIGGHDVIVLTSGPGTFQMLGQLQWMLNQLQGRHAQRITVVSGYFPLSRSDKDEGDAEFALPSYIVSMLQAAANNRLDRIVSVDLHAPQIVMAARAGLITELSMLRVVLERAVIDVLAEGMRGVLLFPDASSAKRASAAVGLVEKTLGVHLATVIGIKHRESGSSIELKQLVGAVDELQGAVGLSVDDEIATARTNAVSALAVKETYGAAEVRAVVTHGVLCDAAAKLSLPNCPIDRVYLTDTIPVETRPELSGLVASGRLVVIPWTEELAEALYHLHWNLSIRELR